MLTFLSEHGMSTASPSAADAFYIVFFSLYLALVLMVRREAIRMVPALWLDGGIAGLGAAALCAAFAFGGIERLTGGGAREIATNLAYPVGDVLLLTLVVAGTVLLSGRRHAGWYLVAAGCALNGAGDTFNLLNGAGAPVLGDIVDAIAWPASLLLMSIALWLPRVWRTPSPRSRRPASSSPAPERRVPSRSSCWAA